jgi:hypothetical protein
VIITLTGDMPFQLLYIGQKDLEENMTEVKSTLPSMGLLLWHQHSTQFEKAGSFASELNSCSAVLQYNGNCAIFPLATVQSLSCG